MTGVRAVAVIVGIALTLAGCGGARVSYPHEVDWATREAAALHPDLGPFAGYMWAGDVDSAHASWTVPRLLPGSAHGEAATWIGAEAPGRKQEAPFVQVGINQGNTGSGPFAYAFYSTTTLHFHPVHLFDVSPGDQVSVTLRRRAGGWQIVFIDRSAGRRRMLWTAEGTGRRFNEAQYIQEDVTDARAGRPFPYPSLSPVRFTGVTADGRTPRTAELTSSWLTEAYGYLAPAPLRDDAFTLTHARLSSAGFWYLRTIATQDAATAAAIPPLLRWAQRESSPGAGAAARHFTSVLRATVGTLGDQRWPPGVRARVAALRAHVRALMSLLSRLPRVTDAQRTAWGLQFERLADLVAAESQAARRALRLPSPTALASAS